MSKRKIKKQNVRESRRKNRGTKNKKEWLEYTNQKKKVKENGKKEKEETQ